MRRASDIGSRYREPAFGLLHAALIVQFQMGSVERVGDRHRKVVLVGRLDVQRGVQEAAVALDDV